MNNERLQIRVSEYESLKSLEVLYKQMIRDDRVSETVVMLNDIEGFKYMGNETDNQKIEILVKKIKENEQSFFEIEERISDLKETISELKEELQ